MYQDFYTRFSDEATANAILYTTTPAVTDEQGNVTQEEYTTPNYINIDVLGVLYEQPPEPTPEDYTPVPLEGWHVNVRVMPGEDASALEGYQVNPEPMTWRRVWG
jgi:hypothetical protein